MTEFSYFPEVFKGYGGANGSKIAVKTPDGVYMIKFPGMAKKNTDMSYANGCISEHLGSSIFNMAGIPAQETMLGWYSLNNTKKLVVACKDFTYPDYEFYDFGQIKNTYPGCTSNGYGTDLEDIMECIEHKKGLDTDKIKEFFWDMFIVDALIGNWDRHNGNWGVLKKRETEEISIAPVFDCGSCLFPQLTDENMKEILLSRNAINLRIFERPVSAIKVNGKKINYFDYISSLSNADCNEALKRIVPRVNMSEIEKFINKEPLLSDLQKEFYVKMLNFRKKHILDFSLEKYHQSGFHDSPISIKNNTVFR